MFARHLRNSNVGRFCREGGASMSALYVAVILVQARPMAFPVGFVQEATSGCRAALNGEAMPLRSLRPMLLGSYLQAPRGGYLTVVFKNSGARYRLLGRGQAQVGRDALIAVERARVERLPSLDMRLTDRAEASTLYGSKTAATLSPYTMVPTIEESNRATPELPSDSAPLPPLPALPPPPDSPVTPAGLVRTLPVEIRLSPAPPGGAVVVAVEYVNFDRPIAPRKIFARMSGGRIRVPAGFFRNDSFCRYRVSDAKGETLASADFRVLTPKQRGELERTERLAEAAGDDGSLLSLAQLYADLRMPVAADRLYRRIATRRPNDVGLRETIAEAEEQMAHP